MRSCLKTSGARIFSASANSLRAAARDPLTRAWSTSSRHARLVHSRHARKVGTSSQQGDTVLGALLESSLRVQHSIGSIESKQDAMAKNFSDSMADQKLTHAKFAKNIVKQISEGQERVEASQERVEASQERFSDELFDVRQGVAKNGIFAQSGLSLPSSSPPLSSVSLAVHSLRWALTPAIFFSRRPLRPTLPRRLAAWLWPTACVAAWPSPLSTILAI